jgi:hypothetical protein
MAMRRAGLLIFGVVVAILALARRICHPDIDVARHTS